MNILDNINENINPCDDFYNYATGNWIKNNPQPDEYPTWNVFTKIEEDNIDRIRDIITSSKTDSSVINHKINDCYNIIMNYDKRNKDGKKPLISYINKHVNNLKTNMDVILESARNNIEMFFDTGLQPDSKGSGKYEVAIYQDGLGLGNKDYYLKDTAENKKYMNAYSQYIIDLYEYLYNDNNIALMENNKILSIENLLAPSSYSVEELQDPILNYNRISVNELSEKTCFNWRLYLDTLGYTETNEVIVSNIEFLKRACKLLLTLDTSYLKTFYEWQVINIAATKLDDKIYDLVFKYSQVFTGAKVQYPKEKRAINKINNAFSEVIGQIYVKKYFNEDSKNDVINIIENLKASFETIINSQTWMSNETKEKALDKLHAMKLKIGYPDKFEDFSDIPIDINLTYFENSLNIREYFRKKNMEKHYNKEIDYNEWYMDPQTINAYYDCIQNEICFPAGILQYPFYDTNRDPEYNYGAIGTIIAHEMTHAFDNHGRHYDKHGILNDWWTESDSNKFNELTDITKERFNNLEALPGLKCDGSLTLGENIADYGGLKIAYYACKNIMKHGIGTTKNWEHKFFLAYANNWSEITTDEAIKNLVANNEHTINRLRVNGTLPMFTPWIDYYNVKKANKLYLDIDKRAKIW